MYEFEDVNTADIRYLIGVPLLFAAIIVPPARASCLKEKRLNIHDNDFYRSGNHFHIHSCFGKMTTVIANGKIRLTWRYGFNERNSDVRYRGSGG